MSNSQTQSESFPYQVLARPPFHLESFDPETRWEITRRHPAYICSWPFASRHYNQVATDSEQENQGRVLALSILARIGISGDPPSPEREFAELEDCENLPEWFSGAAQPLTNRRLVRMLISGISAPTFQAITRLFCDVSQRIEDDPDYWRFVGVDGLLQLKHHELDCLTLEPILAINPAAPNQQINLAATEIANHFRSQVGITVGRQHRENFPAYFRVWDKREGFKNGDYDLSHEATLREVEQEIGRSHNTVAYQYRCAFQMITGHEYTLENYIRVFYPIKLYLMNDLGRVSQDLMKKAASDAPLRAAALNNALHSQPLMDESIARNSRISRFVDRSDQVLAQIRLRVEAGASAADIIREFEMPADRAHLVRDLVDRLNEVTEK